MQIVVLLAIIWLLPNTAVCQQKDSIFLFKGEVLIGDIKKVELGVITIDEIALNYTNVKLYKIKSIKSAQMFEIETNEKKIYYSALFESSQPGWCDIKVADTGKISIRITDIYTLVFLRKGFLNKLDGNVGGGFSFSKSSSIGQVNLNATVKYGTKAFKNELSLSTLGSIDSSKYSRDNENIELFTLYKLNSSWFVAGLLGYQRNIELSLARRFQEMVGAGNNIFIGENWQLLAISGLIINQEKNTSGVSSGLLLEVPIMLRFDFYKFSHPNIQINTIQTFYYGLTEVGRVRYNGSSNFSWELVQNLSLTLSLYNNYDSKPPSATSSNTNYGIVIGISYKF